MPTDRYQELTTALVAAGLTGQLQGEDQLIVSCQNGPVWPNRGNSCWVSYKEDSWYLVTWSPVAYRVPPDQNIVALCSACMALGPLAMHKVPAEIITRFGLQELNQSDFRRIFPS